MATAATGVRALRVYLEMIKIEHSIFALPFAMIGMMWAARASLGTAWPGWITFGLIVTAMVSCRSAAMAYNRIADRDVDAENPRTRMRAIPAGLLSLRQASLYFFFSCAVFLTSAALLNPLTLALSPVALGVTLFYSRTKRFTSLSHFVLGLSLGIAPAAAWIAVTGRLDFAILPLVAGVLLWTAGFDIIYSLQDEEFDREHGLRSLPRRLGKGRALTISRICHVLAPLFLGWAGWLVGAGAWYWLGVGTAAALLVYEQSLVRPDDLSKVNLAFFTLNGFVSIGLFAFALIDQIAR
ncbi:MAG TPA: UbiA-like polyprenyltransferase [Fimbriimonadaceae bacterium]|nr:UbiA-like polyprenyltransferase [Fimbriimonadaceae bacterium]HRJ97880.1 UbiA-like polyprenyltransferase [Fimbriimonadaceae bacterium]